MKAAVWTDYNKVELQEVPVPEKMCIRDSINHCFYRIRRGINFPDSGNAFIGMNQNYNRILASVPDHLNFAWLFYYDRFYICYLHLLSPIPFILPKDEQQS